MPAASEELTSGIYELGLTKKFCRLESLVTFVLVSSFKCCGSVTYCPDADLDPRIR
jgi:hypothetical protein